MLIALGAAAQATVTEVIELRSRRGSEMLPMVQPLVAPGGSVSALDSKLVVRATPEQIAEIKRVLAALDKPPRQLLIFVQQDGFDEASRRSAGVSGRYKFDGGAVAAPGPHGTVPHQPTIEIGDERNSSQSGGTHQVRALEGREAQIHIGQSVPYVSSYSTPGGGVTEQVDFRDVLTGFIVVPRVQGKMVELEISPRAERLVTRGVARGSVQVQSINTTISAPLGEWFDIGSAVQTVSQQSSGMLHRGSSREQTQHRVMVKVEEVR